jgi:hypothetical protein
MPKVISEGVSVPSLIILAVLEKGHFLDIKMGLCKLFDTKTIWIKDGVVVFTKLQYSPVCTGTHQSNS